MRRQDRRRVQSKARGAHSRDEPRKRRRHIRTRDEHVNTKATAEKTAVAQVLTYLTFLFYFLPIVLGIYYIVPNKCKNIILLVSVIKMKESKDILSSILKTTQMGQIGIRSVLNAPLQTNLKQTLRNQLREYDSIEREAMAIANSRGWEMDSLSYGIIGMTNAMVRAHLSFGNTNSKAAAMMINGSTRGIIKGVKNLHAISSTDERVSNLCQKLLDYEHENIRNLQEFL